MNEAWLHYRHCETLRLEYLKMYFTGYVATVGFIITLYKPGTSTAPGPTTHFSTALILAVLYCFSLGFYIITIRLNLVTDFYGNVMERTREYFFGHAGHAATTWNYGSIGLHRRGPGIFRIQRALKQIVEFLSICLIAAEVVLWRALRIDGEHPVLRARSTLAIAITMCVLLIGAMISAHVEQKLSKKKRHEILYGRAGQL